MKQFRKVTVTMVALVLGAGLCVSCGNQDAGDTKLSEKTYTASSECVKLLGRTHSEGEILWLAHSASGVEFTFTGTSAEFTMVGDSSATATTEGNYARFAVYVNGTRVLDTMMTSTEQTYSVYSSDTQAETTVQLVKLSESTNSILGIKAITATSVGKIQPTEERTLKVEFIGDSITCGYGVDDEERNHHFSTATEDATKSYAYQTAQALDADYSMVSFSGYGVYSGYVTNGERNKTQTVPKYYDKLGFSYGTYDAFQVRDVEWDFTQFVPDVVVVNLGTNDMSYCGSDPAKQQEFTDAYVEFLTEIREKNPDAYILCTLGIMGDTLYPCVEAAVDAFTAQSGDTRVSAMPFAVQSEADGYAADWHPTLATHTKAAAVLTAELERILALQ